MRKIFFIFLILLALIVKVSAQPSEAKTAFDDGARMARAGYYEKALESYQKAARVLKAGRTNNEFLTRIYFNIGVCLYQLKFSTEAIEEFTKAIALSGGGYQKAFYALGMAQSDLKDWGAATEAFRKAIILKNDDGEAWFDLALVLIEKNDFEAAREAFQNSIKYRTAAYPDAHNNLGVIFALRGDFETAEKEFRIALTASNGTSVEARNNLRYCESYRQDSAQNSIGKLEFSRKTGEGE